MTSSVYNDKKLEAYLLNELPEDEIPALGDELLRDDELFQRLQTVEMNLFDRYLENEMAGEERQRFEATFLSNPANQWKLEEERVFRESLELLRKRRSQFPQLAAAAVILISLAVLGVWLATRSNNQSSGDLTTKAVSTPTPEINVTPIPQPSPSPTNPPTERKPPSHVEEKWLYLRETTTGVMGPGDDVPITVSPDTDSLSLRFELLEDAATKDVFRVSIKDEFDYPIFPLPGTIEVKPTEIRYRGRLRRALAVDVPIKSLKPSARYSFEIPELRAKITFVLNRTRNRP